MVIAQGYASAQESSSGEEWWPVVAGIRESIDAGRGGGELLNNTYENVATIYGKEEWWPAVAALYAVGLQIQDTQGQTGSDFHLNR